jgi:hypothetical protein
MKRFVAKDLMVSVLPDDGGVRWRGCEGCTCTNKGSDEVDVSRCGDGDLAVLEACLNRALSR